MNKQSDRDFFRKIKGKNRDFFRKIKGKNRDFFRFDTIRNYEKLFISFIPP